MNNELFIKLDDTKKRKISNITNILNDIDENIYILEKPLILKEEYEYKDAVIVLIKNQKLLFIDLANDKDSDEFIDFVELIVEDIAKLSWMHGFEKLIGRARKWKHFIVSKNIDEIKSNTINEIALDKIEDKRLVNILVSFFIGSINEVKRVNSLKPTNLIEMVKQKIVLFDTNQVKFIFNEPDKKSIVIQGLAGTGKTELLFHKLKEIYLSNDNAKILLTCHNKILADELKRRVKEFFNITKVTKQIDDEFLKITHAWGSKHNVNLGTYRIITNFYKLPFYNYYQKSFDDACKETIQDIKSIKEQDNFKYNFDYILIDESQDFPDSFFELCELVTKEKVYIAGDIFQDIFEYSTNKVEADFILNRCYRTDPKNLMFAHSLGMGLFEKPHLRWLEKDEWEKVGYIYDKQNNNVQLKRIPLKRFDDIDESKLENIDLKVVNNMLEETLNILANIKKEFNEIKPDDIAIIFLDTQKYIYQLSDTLVYKIYEKFGWEVNKGYETKQIKPNTLFVSNKNNTKGLEFPYVICITNKITNDLSYRNTLYTMLTRSFIKSYLLVKENIDKTILEGLENIKSNNCIQTYIPDMQEQKNINNMIIKYNKYNKSYEEFLDIFFTQENIQDNQKPKLQKMILDVIGKTFDEDKVLKYIQANKEFI